ncbi:MAG: TonB-dependent receptor [Sphingomonas bacterium]|uniref:TonB-dependent receptor n=1 Tax=Sphingomonas bacterium TaxID=1895847 RepID=UPI002603E3E9|nr:TonB-dependent receptor [Sphingomonas bacterium]MDB5708144.1 TonB-dependent receptor [Sphingomonas bacterium]
MTHSKAASWRKAAILLGSASLLAPVAAHAQARPAPRAPAQGDQADGVPDVIVTAQRREESLQRTPLAVTALGVDDLREKNITSLADLGRAVPNLAISSAGYTAPSNALPVIYIRGIGQQDPSIFSDPGVPVYVDGIYVARSAGGAIDLPDIQRVEVLRGPQGTLFGKNAVGGAVNLVTQTPGKSPGSRFELSGGSDDLLHARGYTDLALSDQAGLTLAADYMHENGFGNRLAVGTNKVLGRLGDKRHFSLRGRLHVAPSEALSIDISADYTRYRDTAQPSQTRVFAANLLTLYNTSVGTPAGSPLTQSVAGAGDYDNYSLNPQPVRDDLGGVSATIAYKLGGVTLKSITAYRASRDTFSRDADSAPMVFLEAARNMRSDQFSQEVQLLGGLFDDKVDFILGAFYLHDTSSQTDVASVLPGLYVATHNPQTDISRTTSDQQTTNSYAVFGQATWHIAQGLNFTAGLRYTRDSKQAVISSNSPESGIIYVPPTAFDDSWHALTPRFALDYRISPNILVYASASRGFKSGGFNGRPSNIASLSSFAPETVWSYETGIKADLLQHHVRLNLAGFIADYQNIQLQRQILVIGTGIVSDIRNVAASRIKGLEGELTILPVRGLELTASGGYTTDKYTNIQTGAPVTATGVIPYTPKWTYSLAARYAIDLGNSGTVTPSVDYAYRSSAFVTPDNDPAGLIPSYGIMSARLSYVPRNSFWEVSAFVTNLTDKRYFISKGVSAGIGIEYQLLGAPRRFGGTVAVHF